jgi:hypothetical protein
MIIVPTTEEFPDKVFCTKCTEQEFVIGQMFRYSGSSVSLLLQPLLFLVIDFLSSRIVTRPFLKGGDRMKMYKF